MKLGIYKDSFRQECLENTSKDMRWVLPLSFAFILLFTLTDASNFSLDYYFWRGIGLLAIGGAFLLSVIPTTKRRLNANYLFSAAYIGILVMMQGVFIKTIFLNSTNSEEMMQVTIGIVSVYFLFNFFAAGAKRAFAIITLVSIVPLFFYSILYYQSELSGYLITVLFAVAATSLSLLRAHQHSRAKFEYQQKLRDNERELVQKHKELERMNEELRGFNHSISHDFKTPIRSANSFSQLLKRDLNLKNYHKLDAYVDFISGSMMKMNSLLEALNAVSDIAQKKVKFDKVELEPIIEDAFNEVSFGMTRKCEFHIAEDLPTVFGDKNLLREVFTNILSNALKYSRYQSTTVINVGYYQENDETVIFVKDNGVGFKMDYKDQLFKMFKRLHNEDEYEGIGVGLAIVKRVMGYHQGEVWASSIQGNGATFYLSFPRYISEPELALGTM